MIISFLLLNLILILMNSETTWNIIYLGFIITTLYIWHDYRKHYLHYKNQRWGVPMFNVFNRKILWWYFITSGLLVGISKINMYFNLKTIVLLVFYYFVFLAMVSLGLMFERNFACFKKNINKKHMAFFASLVAITSIWGYFVFTFDVQTVQSYVNNHYIPTEYKKLMIECSKRYTDDYSKNYNLVYDREDFNAYFFKCIGVENRIYLSDKKENEELSSIQNNIHIINDSILKK